MNGPSPLGEVLGSALVVYLGVLFAYVILSWVPRPPEPLVPIRAGLGAMVEPVVRPLRRIIPPLRLGGVAVDLSILIVFFGINLLLLPLARQL